MYSQTLIWFTNKILRRWKKFRHIDEISWGGIAVILVMQDLEKRSISDRHSLVQANLRPVLIAPLIVKFSLDFKLVFNFWGKGHTVSLRIFLGLFSNNYWLSVMSIIATVILFLIKGTMKRLCTQFKSYKSNFWLILFSIFFFIIFHCFLSEYTLKVAKKANTAKIYRFSNAFMFNWHNNGPRPAVLPIY